MIAMENEAKNKKVEKETELIDNIVSAKQKPLKQDLENWKKEKESSFEVKEYERYQPIKDYWYKYLKNNDYYIFQHDDEMLVNLNNISMGRYFSEDKEYEKINLFFSFDENKFFKNKELSISISYTGSYVEKSVGTAIDWIENPTVKYQKRRQRNKKTGEQRVVTDKV
jgi:hypothetical protein